MNIKNILDEISSESSTIKKMEILSKYKDSDLLKQVLFMAYSKTIKFYLRIIPEYVYNPNQDIPPLQHHLNSLSRIIKEK